MTDSVDDALQRLAREDSGRVLASLARRFNDLDVADEAVQDALIEASQRWPSDGMPDNPGGWLYRVAQRKAIDRTRRAGAERRRLDGVAADLATAASDLAVFDDQPMLIDSTNDHVDDERLRLILLCCHPALNADAQVALTLRLVGGLTTEEIAAAFLVPTPTLAARITRAKKKIRAANIPLSVPDELDDRMNAVLAVLYLIFNEGYLSRGTSTTPMRVDLCEEAIRLGAVVATLTQHNAEARGLLILMQFTHARRDARFRNDELVLLDDQDRGAWHLDEIQAANRLLGDTMRMKQPGAYQLQAIIAAHHANARTARDTDWPRIVGLYDQLIAMRPSPIVALNRAVSVAMADGPLEGLRELDDIRGLDDYYLFHSVQGELLARSGDTAAARAALERAQDLVSNPSERDHLATKLAHLN